MADNTLYDVLGVPRDVSDNDLKKAYRKLAKEFHPDKNPHTADKFKEISYAYEVLSNPQKRQIYNRHGIQGLKENGGPGMDAEDILPHIFGGGIGGLFSGFGRTQVHKNKSQVHSVKVTLEDLYMGKSCQIEVERREICPKCSGTGGKASAISTCGSCQGSGQKIMLRPVVANVMQPISIQCAECYGSGEKINEKEACTSCKGRKTIKQKRTLDYIVERGYDTQKPVMLFGKGDQSSDAANGDVVLQLVLEPHETFFREQNDLFVAKTISLTEALCGFQMIIRQLDGRTLLISQPAGEVISPASVKGVRGEGMPIHGGDSNGNLYIKFTVAMPPPEFIRQTDLKQIDALLNDRPPAEKLPQEFEDVTLEDYVPAERGESSGERREAYGDDDEEEQASPSCVNQ